MKSWWLITIGVLIGLLVGGGLYLVGSRPRGNEITLLPPPTTAPLQIHVIGAVILPDIYALPQGSHVSDAIQAAGGFSSTADDQSINLASTLRDGEQIVVPFQSRTQTSPDTVKNTPPLESQDFEKTLPASNPSSGLININTATQAELETLPGIGPVTAQKIIDYRETEGTFSRVEDIENVSGIGPVTFEKIKDLISVNGSP